MFSGCQQRQMVQIHKTLGIPTPISVMRLSMKKSETSVDLNHVTRLSAREDLTEVIAKSPIFYGNRRFITVLAQSKYYSYPEPGESGLLPLFIFLQETSHLLVDVPSGVFVFSPPSKPSMHFCSPPYVRHAPSSSARFNHLNNICRGVQTMVLPTLQFSPTSSKPTSSLLCRNIFRSTLHIEHPQCDTRICKPIRNKAGNCSYVDVKFVFEQHKLRQKC